MKQAITARELLAQKGKESFKEGALDLFMQQRRAAEASQEPELTLDEINAEIRAAREERRHN